MFRFDRFQNLCTTKGMKMSALFDRVGKKSDYGSSLKRTKNVNPEFVAAWAEALGTSVEYLMGETDDPEPQAAPRIQMDDTEKEEWSRLWDAATPEARETALRVLRLADQAKG